MKQQYSCVLNQFKVVFDLNSNRNESGENNDVTI